MGANTTPEALRVPILAPENAKCVASRGSLWHDHLHVHVHVHVHVEAVLTPFSHNIYATSNNTKGKGSLQMLVPYQIMQYYVITIFKTVE